MLLHLYRVSQSLVREHFIKATQRSDKWPSVRRQFLTINKSCAACGSTIRPQVHHKDPFHIDPADELNPDNLITLCMGPNECHFWLGHLQNWKGYNPTVEEDAKLLIANIDKFTILKEEILKRK